MGSYETSGRTEQKTLFSIILLLLGDLAVGADSIEDTIPSDTSIRDVACRDLFHCCVTIYCAIA
jgi:hypothetical protein